MISFFLFLFSFLLVSLILQVFRRRIYVAEAIKKEQLSLTPLYIENIKVQKWSGQVPTTVAGNSGFMIELGNKPAN